MARFRRRSESEIWNKAAHETERAETATAGAAQLALRHFAARVRSVTTLASPRSLGITAAAVLVILALALVARLPTLHMPVNRDISAFATVGSRMLYGELPYRDYFDHKQPLIYVVFWLLAELAPRSNVAIQLAAALASGLGGAMLFLFLRGAITAPAAFTLGCLAVTLGATRYVEGVDLYAEQVLIPVACAAVLLPYFFRNSRWRGLPVLAGLLGGLAILAKGVGALVLPAAVIVLIASRRSRSQSVASTLLFYAAGVSLLPGLIAALYLLQGGLQDLVYANATYNLLYVSAQPAAPLLDYGGPQMNWLLGASLLLGLALLVNSRAKDLLSVVLVLWLLGSMIGAKVGRNDYPHYFAPILPPALALLLLAWSKASRSSRRHLAPATVALIVAVGLPFAIDVALAFGRAPGSLAIRLYGEQAEVWTHQEEVGEYLRSIAGPTDTLFVAGAEPGFYWQSGLQPSTRYLYDYPLNVDASVRAKLERALSDDPPAFVVIPGDTVPPYLSSLLASLHHEVVSFGSIHVLQLRRSADG